MIPPGYRPGDGNRPPQERTYTALAVEFRDTALPPGTHHLSVAITREDQADPRFLAILAYLDELAKRALEEYEARGTPTMGPLG